MANITINQFNSGSIADSSLAVIGDPTTGALTQTSYHALRDYFQNTGAFVLTSSYYPDSSSFNLQISNVYASESNYITTSSFNNFSGSYINDSASFNNRINAISGSELSGSFVSSTSFGTYSSSVATQLINVYSSESNYIPTSSFNSFTASNSILVGNVFASQSNYTQLPLFDAYTASIGLTVVNVYASQSQYETTASFSQLSASYHTDSSSFYIGNVNTYASQSNYTPSSSFNTLSASYHSDSGSFLVMELNIFASQSNYVPTASYQIDSGSWNNRIASLSSSVQSLTGSLLTSSFYTYTASVSNSFGQYQTTSSFNTFSASLPAIITTIGTPTTSYASGALLSGNTLTFGFATNALPGLMSAGTQTFGGAKTLQNTFTAKHFFDSSAVPTIASGSGAGTSPTLSITGNDQCGFITIATGTSPTASTGIATITFNGGFTATNNSVPSIFATNASASTVASSIWLSSNTASWAISGSLSASTIYLWGYQVRMY